MTFREKWKKFLLISIFFGLTALVIYGCYYAKSVLPKQLTVVVDENGYVNFHVPFDGTLTSVDKEVAFYDSDGISSRDTVIVGNGKNPILNVSEEGSYELVYRLFGLFDFQKIKVDAVDERKLIPAGITMGLYLKTDGVMVVGISELTGADSKTHTPAKGCIEPGDYILAVGSSEIHNKDELIKCVSDNGDKELEITIRRNNEQKRVLLRPVLSEDMSYKLGIWVRDDCQGIGTVTYIDPEDEFGALGHSISDIDTGLLVASHQGEIRESKIHSIRKGTEGTPGSVCGSISYDKSSLFGEIFGNCKQGVYGRLNKAGLQVIRDLYDEAGIAYEAVPVGYQQEITTGRAYIRSAVSGRLTDYEINITAVDTSNSSKNKGLVIEVTDKRLLELTGGIVQGMSGSPILQNGKIIGAVTHVFIQDSSKGYGIFIEKMLESQYFLGGY